VEEQMTSSSQQATSTERIGPPRDCSFHPSDWHVLARSWFAVARRADTFR